MKIAITGPMSTALLIPYLDHSQRSRIPQGLPAPSVSGLVSGFLDRGVEVVAVTLDQSVADEVVATGPNLRLCIGPYRPRGRARDGFRPERAYVAATLAREQPAVAHAHWTYEFALGALASRIPTLVTVHDWAPQVLRYHFHPYRAVRLLMQAETLRRGRYLTAVSPYIQERVQRWTRRETALVPNALAGSSLGAGVRLYNKDAPLILAVNAGFGRLKNVETLLRAFAILRSSRPTWRLSLVGAGYEHNGSAHQWARARALDGGVRFVGHVGYDEVPKLMASADVLVHPSLQESFGLVLLEAMQQGLPVVAGAHSGAVPWVLADGRAGILTDVRSPHRLASSIGELLDAPDRWAMMSNRGRERAEDFQMPRVLDQYWELYGIASS